MSLSPNISIREFEKNTPRVLAITPAEQSAFLDIRLYDLMGKDGGIDPAKLKALSTEQVTSLQTHLNAAGFDVGASDGIAGKKTMHGLSLALAKQNAVTLLTSTDDLSRDEVRSLQRSLTRLGYDTGKPDGLMGQNTARGIAAFLEQNGADAESINPALRKDVAALVKPAPVIGAVGALDPEFERVLGLAEHSRQDIKTIQTHLEKAGYEVGAIDGDFGSVTRRELIRYLEQHPEAHKAVANNMKLEVEIYAAEYGVSDNLRTSMDLRDFNNLPTRNPDGTVLLHPNLIDFIEKHPEKAQYVDMARAAATKYGLDGNMLANQLFKESNRLDPNAVGPVTKYEQAVGMVQMQPGTAAQYGVSREQLFNPAIAIDTMARHMKVLTDKYGSQEIAALEYNGGRGATLALERSLGKGFAFEEAIDHWDNQNKIYGQGSINLYRNQTRGYGEAIVSDEWDTKTLLAALRKPQNAAALQTSEEPGLGNDTILYDGVDMPKKITGEFTSAAAKPEEAAPKSALGVSFDSAALGVNVGLVKEKPAADQGLVAQNSNRFDPALNIA